MIYIGFSSPNTFKIGAELIKWWTKKPYSHVYFKFISSREEIPDTVYHAAHGMVHFKTYNNFLFENKVIFEYPLNSLDNKKLKVLAYCMKIAGEYYDTLNLVKIFYTDVLNYFNIELKTFDGKGYICSELVGKVLQEELGIIFNKPLHLLKPNDIEEALVLWLNTTKK